MSLKCCTTRYTTCTKNMKIHQKYTLAYHKVTHFKSHLPVCQTKHLIEVIAHTPGYLVPYRVPKWRVNVKQNVNNVGWFSIISVLTSLHKSRYLWKYRWWIHVHINNLRWVWSNLSYTQTNNKSLIPVGFEYISARKVLNIIAILVNV